MHHSPEYAGDSPSPWKARAVRLGQITLEALASMAPFTSPGDIMVTPPAGPVPPNVPQLPQNIPENLYPLYPHTRP